MRACAVHLCIIRRCQGQLEFRARGCHLQPVQIARRAAMALQRSISLFCPHCLAFGHLEGRGAVHFSAGKILQHLENKPQQPFSDMVKMSLQSLFNAEHPSCRDRVMPGADLPYAPLWPSSLFALSAVLDVKKKRQKANPTRACD